MWSSWQFYFNNILLGVGLSMDACAVSMANGLNEPKIRVRKICLIAGAFAFFQAAMPMIGWVCVHFVAEHFTTVTKAIPYIALGLLAFIGGKMLYEGIKSGKEKRRQDTQKIDTENASEEGENTAEQADGQPTETAATAAEPANENAENVQETQPIVVVEALEGASQPKTPEKRLTLWVLFTQAIATSIDALSVGFTIADYNVWEALVAVLIIAVITFGISFGAVFLGKKFGTKLGNKAEILGGCILIGIGLEIFITGFF